MSIKPLLFAASLMAAAITSHAQVGPNPTVTAQTREMATRLKLNEGQYVRLLAANRTRYTRQQQIEHATAGNAAARSTQLAELQGQYEQECSRILSPSQLSQLLPEATPQPANGLANNGNG